METKTRTFDVRLLVVAAVAAIAVTIWAAGAFAAGGPSSSSGSSGSPSSDVPAWFTQAQDDQQQAPSDDCPDGDNGGSGGGGGGGSDQDRAQARPALGPTGVIRAASAAVLFRAAAATGRRQEPCNEEQTGGRSRPDHDVISTWPGLRPRSEPSCS